MNFDAPKNLTLVREFHQVFGHPAPAFPTDLSPETLELRMKLVDEEADEMAEAWNAGNLVEVADAVIDSLYVTYGWVVCLGMVDSFEEDAVPRLTEVVLPTLEVDHSIKLLLSSLHSCRATLRQLVSISTTQTALPQPRTAIRNSLERYSKLLYCLLVEIGLPADVLFEEVHASNMSKLGADGKPVYREDGKILKGPNFREPNLARIIYGEDHHA